MTDTQRLSEIARYLYLFAGLPEDYLEHSRSQFGQDMLALALLGPRRGEGFFVEFGAIDGVHNSNSYYFEKRLGWSGIVAEPSRRWHEALRANRTCAIETRCVYAETGRFLEFGDTGKWKGGNTLVEFREADGKKRDFSDVYAVETVSLLDLLRTWRAPGCIDFISIDTEGTEFEILRTFDFSAFRFGLMLVEHNRVADKREAIQRLLAANGYHRLPIPDEITVEDDWYAGPDLAARFGGRFGSGTSGGSA
jgi:FkbM family methyltransferase